MIQAVPDYSFGKDWVKINSQSLLFWIVRICIYYVLSCPVLPTKICFELENRQLLFLINHPKNSSNSVQPKVAFCVILICWPSNITLNTTSSTHKTLHPHSLVILVSWTCNRIRSCLGYVPFLPTVPWLW